MKRNLNLTLKLVLIGAFLVVGFSLSIEGAPSKALAKKISSNTDSIAINGWGCRGRGCEKTSNT
jgi:hypothetical protein